MNFDPSLSLQLAGNASSYSIGGVLSHRYLDDTEHPIAFGVKDTIAK